MKRILFTVLLCTFFALGASAQTPTAPRAGAPAQNPPARPPATGTQTPPPPANPAQVKPPAAAPTPPPPFPADAKVGFVNMQVVVAESKLGKTGQDKMKALQSSNQTKLAALAKGIQDQQQKISTQQGVVNDSTLQQLKRDLDRMNLDAQSAQQKAQADEQNLNEDLLKDFSEKAMPIIEALRVEKNLWIIFGVQDDTQGGGQLIVASANAGLDLSFEVIKRLDAKTPGAQ